MESLFKSLNDTTDPQTKIWIGFYTRQSLQFLMKYIKHFLLNHSVKHVKDKAMSAQVSFSVKV
jgi:hypothetical protein